MDNTKSQRFKLVIDYLISSKKVRNQAELVKQYKLSSGYISQISTGKKGPSEDFINRLAKDFPEINPVWILTGFGDMLNTQPIQNVTASGDNSVATGNNSSITINASNSIYEKMIENLTKENINLKMRLLRLAEIIDKNGIPCDDACKL